MSDLVERAVTREQEERCVQTIADAFGEVKE